jgi:hypothetical protein
MAEKLSHNWLNAFFGVITLPDPIYLNSTQLILKCSELPRLAGFELSRVGGSGAELTMGQWVMDHSE